MRITRMKPGDHDALVVKLAAERRQKADAVRLIAVNTERGWRGVPAADRRRQEERFPKLRAEIIRLDAWIAALADATDACPGQSPSTTFRPLPDATDGRRD